MSITFTDLKEYFRIKKNKVTVRTKVFSGKEGNFHVFICPTLNVSGYGDTEEDAKESFTYNLKLFCQDLLALQPVQIDKELKKLGFEKEVFSTKNYSKAYVDEGGVLRGIEGLDKNTISSSMLEAAL